MSNHDLDWLLSQAPENDSLDIKTNRIQKLTQIIKDVNMDSLPITFGLFGNWGCGKTTFLGYLAQNLIGEYKVIYFNAWKYAGFLEIIPALIYNILNALPIESSSKTDKIGQIMMFLGKKYGSQVGDWASKFLGVNPADIVKDIIEIKDNMNEPQKNRKKVLDQYYTQVDKAQDLLQSLLKDCVKPIIVLIDELDRCEPGEAFDVIKQLRIFFSMRKIPIIFILGANPEPIGLAIRHQYGLDKNISDYEANRILEKFVDSYVDMSDPLPLGKYISNLWNKYSYEAKNISLLHEIDRNIHGLPYNFDTIKNCNILSALTTNNRLYSNLRVLDKSLHYVQIYAHTKTNLLWTAWHLEILKQVHTELAEEVAILASEIGWITSNAHLKLIKELLECYIIDQDANIPYRTKNNLFSEKGNTAFSIYRSWFWEISKIRLEMLDKDISSEGIEKIRILKKWLGDHNIMTFIICMTAQPVTNLNDFVKTCANFPKNEYLDSWREHGHFKHFSWLLANY